MLYQLQHFGSSEYICKEYKNNLSFPLHLHQSFEFITVLSGEMKITVDGVLYNIKIGESLLIFPNQLHSFESTKSFMPISSSAFPTSKVVPSVLIDLQATIASAEYEEIAISLSLVGKVPKANGIDFTSAELVIYLISPS